VKTHGGSGDLKAVEKGSTAGSNASAGLEESIWLCPIEDRRKIDSSREGMLEDFSLGSYLLLVDFTGRLFRDAKAVISAELAGILNRLGSSAEDWQARLEKLREGRLLGRFFAASRARLREVAAGMGVHHVRKPRRVSGAIVRPVRVAFEQASTLLAAHSPNDGVVRPFIFRGARP